MSTVPMADTIGADAGNIPVTFAKIAYYVSGGGSIPWPQAQIDRFPKAGHVRIDQSPGLSEYAAGKADVADVEPGAGTTANFVSATRQRIARGERGNLYCSIGELVINLEALLNASVSLAQVGLWVADWNLSQAQASQLCGSYTVTVPGHGSVTVTIDAVQWASPSSNPSTNLPGTSRTLKDSNADLSETLPGWFAYVPPKLPPVVTTETRTMEVTGSVTLVSHDSGKTWSFS